MLVLAEIEEDGFVVEAEFLKDDKSFPVEAIRIGMRVRTLMCAPSVRR